jgi:hypothetical protein
MVPPFSLIAAGIGRGFDSNRQSVAADRRLRARGIWGTGAGGKDRTTSGWKDFFGYDAREQEQDRIDEVQAEIEAAKSFDPAYDQSEAVVPTTPGLATPVSMTVDANMQDSSGGSFFSPTAVNTASNAFYNRGGFGSNAASLVAPETQPMGQQYGPQVSYPDGPNAPVTTYDQRVDLGPWVADLDEEQVQEAIDTSWGDNSGMDVTDDSVDFAPGWW